MSAAERLDRIVSMVATLSRAAEQGVEGSTLDELASRHGVSTREVAADLRTLTLLGEHSDADWLLSLRVWQQDDRVSISSAGPFRRPVRLTPEEQLAVQVALALEPGGAPLAAKFAALWAGGRVRTAARDPEPDPSGDDTLAALIRQATREGLEMTLEYAGEGEREPRQWVVQPHQLAQYRGRTYLVAWAVEAAGWRHFRLDRALEGGLTGRRFEVRPDFTPVTRPEEVFRAGGDLDLVTVRFAPSVAGWVTERYPDHEVEPTGAVLVRFRTANRDWLVRRVLEYGAQAEVLAPPAYRDAVRQAVA